MGDHENRTTVHGAVHVCDMALRSGGTRNDPGALRNESAVAEERAVARLRRGGTVSHDGTVRAAHLWHAVCLGWQDGGAALHHADVDEPRGTFLSQGNPQRKSVDRDRMRRAGDRVHTRLGYRNYP